MLQVSKVIYINYVQIILHREIFDALDISKTMK
jgi:hypothetical protein